MIGLAMKNLLLSLVLLHVLPSAASASIIYSTINPTRVVKITDLFIDGGTYDVEFPHGSFVDLFGYPSIFTSEPTFWENETGAEAARDAILAVLNSPTPIPTGLESLVGLRNQIDWFVVPYDMPTNQMIAVKAGFIPAAGPPWRAYPLSERFFTTEYLNLDYAVFTEVAAIPEPTSLAVWAVLATLSFGIFRCVGWCRSKTG